MPQAVPLEIVHDAVPGRIRFRVGALDAELAAAVDEKLRATQGVRRVEVRRRSGSVLVLFTEQADAGAIGRRIAELAEVAARPAAEVCAGTSFELPVLPPGEVVGRAVSGAARAARLLAAAAPKIGEQRAPRRKATGPIVARGAPLAVSPVWHAMSGDATVAELAADAERGLEPSDATARLSVHGPNALAAAPRRSELEILLSQLKSLPVVLLAGSAVLSIATGGVADAIAILAVVGLNAGIGWATESNAEKTLGSLEEEAAPAAVVIRGGEALEIAVEDVVPGDLVVLAPGTLVSFDARVLQSHGLTVDESALTGESAPVAKTVAPLDDDEVALADRTNMVFRGTVVTGGSGLGLVVATGPATQLGIVQRIASELSQRETPLQRQLAHLGTQLVVASGLACGGVFVVGLLRGYRLLDVLRTSVSLAVAAIPEGLPTVAITTLTLGVRRMRRRQVAIRHLAAIETLGAMRVLCLDKTGTITENRMAVVTILANGCVIDVDDGTFTLRGGGVVDPAASPALLELLRTAVLCNEVELVEERGDWVLKGTPTETALVRVALDAGVDVAAVRAAHPIIRTQYRSETRGFMDTLHDAGGGRQLLAVKGRPTEVLRLCARRWHEGAIRPLDDEARDAILHANDEMAGRALRVLGLASVDAEHAGAAADGDLVWLGLVGMTDPPRAGIDELLRRFRGAGIATRMITGDQSATALAVARRIGLGRAEGRLEVLDSTRLDQLDPELVRTLALRTDVFARVSPSQKLELVRALQASGVVVGMTGDGINDGPALKAADVGVAMGRAGTSAAREVADVVLLDDQLGSLLAAVEEGRTIHDDIRKAVHFILATNLSELLLTFGAVTAGAGQPLSPMQLLWINLLTDVLPEIALAVQPPEHDVLLRPPRDTSRPMFSAADLRRIGAEGVLVTSGAAVAFGVALRRYGVGPRAGSVAFATLTTSQLLHAISSRSDAHSVFDSHHLAKNPLMAPTLLGSFALQLAALFAPGLRSLLGVIRPARRDVLLSAVCGVAPFFADELLKWLAGTRRRET